ncbi:hypothetical protein ARMSODRAFT_976188 [Armillaria solidipes]|uniref:F-box domain-containing protein n=1 Tax=Armillaria solidipes TaxID=1076256 RepID=A0A2H3BBY0_9AGAR|nr:hypothetical protein ARMSODRAFT_976188 [Armillaria solidipes]
MLLYARTVLFLYLLSLFLSRSLFCLSCFLFSGDMPFELSTVVDGPLDFRLMMDAIDKHDATLTIPQRLSSIRDGTHLYYKYMERLIALALLPNSRLRVSFAYRRGVVRSYTPTVAVPGPLSLSPLSLNIVLVPPIPFSNAMPNEMWDAVFSFLCHDEQKRLRTVSPVWCSLLTLRTHVCIVLSLPDRWDHILRSPEVDNDSMWLRHFLMELEVDVAASVVRRELQNVVRRVRYSNCPVFPYNSFLRLLPNLETIVIEGPGTRWRDCVPPRIPCPYMLPASVKVLVLSRISLRGYCLECMLSPDGVLESLTLEGVQDGALFLPVDMTSINRVTTRDSLGLTSIRAPFLTAPPAPTLRYLKLDLRTDPYGILVEHHRMAPMLEGGFALLHQLFTTPLGLSDFRAFVDDGETYPLQTRVNSLKELHLLVGTQFFADVSFMWSTVADSLTVLVVHLPQEHTGGLVDHISLAGLNVLSELRVFVQYRGVRSTLRMIETWGSTCKEVSAAYLRVELEIVEWNRVSLGTWMRYHLVKKSLEGTALNGSIRFCGRFELVLRNPVFIVHDLDYEDAQHVMQRLSDDDSMDLSAAVCLRYHGYSLIE